jgi:hypothetical protein
MLSQCCGLPAIEVINRKLLYADSLPRPLHITDFKYKCCGCLKECQVREADDVKE